MFRFLLLVAAIIATLVAVSRCQKPVAASAVIYDGPDSSEVSVETALNGITTTLASFRKESTDAYRELRRDLDELSLTVDHLAVAQAPQPKKTEPVPDPAFRELAGDEPPVEVGVLESKILNSSENSKSSPPAKCCEFCLCKPGPCNCDHPGACIEAWGKANGLARVHIRRTGGETNKYGAETGKGVLLTPDGHHYRSEWLPGSYQRIYVPQRSSGGCASGQCSRGMGSY